MSDKINEGDFVTVNFNVARYTLTRNGQVLNIPCATGDSWVIKDHDNNGAIHYISEGCTISKLS